MPDRVDRLAFHVDVRPAYTGTFTHAAPSTLAGAEARAEAASAESIAGADGWIGAGSGEGGAGGNGALARLAAAAEEEEAMAPIAGHALGRLFGKGFASSAASGAASGGGGGDALGTTTTADALARASSGRFVSCELGNGSVSRRRPFGRDTCATERGSNPARSRIP